MTPREKFIARYVPRKVLAGTKEDLVLYFVRRLAHLYEKHTGLNFKERQAALKGAAIRERAHRLRLGLSLKPALDPTIRARLDDIDKKLGFS